MSDKNDLREPNSLPHKDMPTPIKFTKVYINQRGQHPKHSHKRLFTVLGNGVDIGAEGSTEER